jgi:2-polyprenyl-3-methyl-5-hydroxy-6-metoxy-1,4-benzoquinol methylase
MTDKNWDRTVLLHRRRYASAEDRSRYHRVTLHGLRPPERIAVERWLDPSLKTLEVGCGTGRLAFGLERQLGFQDVTGVDIVEEYVQEARQVAAENRSPLQFEVASVTALPFDEASFEQVICTENLLSHLPTSQTRIQALHELFRALAPGGILVADAMNADSLKWSVRVVRMIVRLTRLVYNPYGYSGNSLPLLHPRGRCPDFLFFLPNRPTLHYFMPAELAFDLLACGFHVIGLCVGQMDSRSFEPGQFRRGLGIYVACRKPDVQALAKRTSREKGGPDRNIEIRRAA